MGGVEARPQGFAETVRKTLWQPNPHGATPAFASNHCSLSFSEQRHKSLIQLNLF
ncbi:hypothetical protein SAMN05444680_12548 [Variovorax sp. YR216]|nr:hypothetical protein SAMN05444680_12548 [Variovorax sp. YR216]